MSTRVTFVPPKTACAVCSGTTTVRPAARRRTVAGDDADDPVGDAVAGALDRDRRADRQVVLGRQSLADERGSRRGIGQRLARGEREVVQTRVEGRVDAEDRHRWRQRGGRARVERWREVGPALERRGGDRDARRGGDGRDGRLGQAVLAEGGDAQVGAADQVADGAADGRVDAGVRGHPGEQDGHAEGDAERAQAGAQRMGARLRMARRSSDIEPAAYRPSLARRAMSGAASCDSRRPSSMVSRIRPSPMTWTRSA